MKQLYLIGILIIFSLQLTAQNYAISLDGTSEYLTVGHNNKQNIGDEFTLEAWIYANSWANEVWRGSLITKDNQGPDRGYAFRCGDNGKLSFVIAIDNAWFETLSPALMNTKQWHHIAGVVANNTVSLYIDGQKVAGGSFDGSPSHLPQALHIGNSTGFGGRFFDGIIDEVRIWEVARTQSEIAANAAVDLGGNEEGLAYYFPMNDGSGNIAANAVVENASANGVGIDDSNWVDGYKLPDFDLSLQSISGIDRVNMKSHPAKLQVEVQNVVCFQIKVDN